MSIGKFSAGVAGAMLLAAASTSASAQCGPGCDGPTNWSGFWLGAGIGGQFDSIEHDWRSEIIATGVETGRGNDDGRSASGFIGTVGVGYDWHIRDRWVLGAYADFDFGTVEHSETDYWNTGQAGWKIEHNNSWSIGGRVGLVTSNTAMFYGIVGYSQADVDVSVHQEDTGAVNGPLNHTANLTLRGLTLGAGLEHDLGNGFFLKGEYRYTNYGDQSTGPWEELTDGVNPTQEYDEFNFDTHAIKLSVAYKFGRRERVEEVSYKDIPPAPPYK